MARPGPCKREASSKCKEYHCGRGDGGRILRGLEGKWQVSCFQVWSNFYHLEQGLLQGELVRGWRCDPGQSGGNYPGGQGRPASLPPLNSIIYCLCNTIKMINRRDTSATAGTNQRHITSLSPGYQKVATTPQLSELFYQSRSEMRVTKPRLINQRQSERSSHLKICFHTLHALSLLTLIIDQNN